MKKHFSKTFFKNIFQNHFSKSFFKIILYDNIYVFIISNNSIFG
jgi:hypothetical protein